MAVLMRETKITQYPDSNCVKVDIELNLDNNEQAASMLQFISAKVTELNSKTNSNVFGFMEERKD